MVNSGDIHPIQYLVKIPGDLSKCTIFLAISVVAIFLLNQNLNNYLINVCGKSVISRGLSVWL